jgi:hypothetical protein
MTSDRVLIEARNDSVQLEKLAAGDLQRNIDGYLPPSWSVRRLVQGYGKFVDAQTTEEDEYRNMRAAFSETQGASNRVFSKVIASHIRSSEIDFTRTMFARHDGGAGDDARYWESTRRNAVGNLQMHGFWMAKFTLTDAVTNSLYTKLMRKIEEQFGGDKLDASLEGRDGADRQLKLSSATVSTIEEMFEISSDPLLLSIVQEYMGVPPIFNTPVAFLNSHAKAQRARDLSDVAQEYHHDLHRLSFVKLFIYLTDVDEGSGPHTLIPGTHRERKPARFWADGRHKDAALQKAGLLKREKRINGKAGTLFLVDTSALHKGAEPAERWRLLAQVQYTNSLFGKPIARSDHKIEVAQTSRSEDVHIAAEHVRKYANRAGVRFMQNYI